MKARPRKVENRVAEELSEVFRDLGFSSVKRIPVLGRTGPDITLNELGISIDVKSRQSVPRSLIIPANGFLSTGEYVGFRLNELGGILKDLDTEKILLYRKPSRTVASWLAHMQDWANQETELKIGALVCHRPKVPTGQTCFVITYLNLRRLHEHYRSLSNS